MLFEYKKENRTFEPLSGMAISDSHGGSEKDLEDYLKSVIGDLIFPEYLVFGNERAFQGEADLFAVNGNGDLVLFELKVHGHYDRGKIYQAMSYAQIFSTWRYESMNGHFKKCFSDAVGDLLDEFEDHFGYRLDPADFNRHQRIIIISHSSSPDTMAVSGYWKSKGIDIEEYFYRFYEAEGKTLFELSNELFFNQNTGHCWINTCSRHIPDAVFDMVSNRKAAIYEERKGAIGNWMNRGHVFLYQNGYGIVASGTGTAAIKDEYNESLGANERSIRLSGFISGVDPVAKIIKSSIPPWKIKELLGRDFYFPNSLVTLGKDEAEKLRSECESVFRGKAQQDGGANSDSAPVVPPSAPSE
jgi:hypothetical protein